jgi:hypothetical protein
MTLDETIAWLEAHLGHDGLVAVHTELGVVAAFSGELGRPDVSPGDEEWTPNYFAIGSGYLVVRSGSERLDPDPDTILIEHGPVIVGVLS